MHSLHTSTGHCDSATIDWVLNHRRPHSGAYVLPIDCRFQKVLLPRIAWCSKLRTEPCLGVAICPSSVTFECSLVSVSLLRVDKQKTRVLVHVLSGTAQTIGTRADRKTRICTVNTSVIPTLEPRSQRDSHQDGVRVVKMESCEMNFFQTRHKHSIRCLIYAFFGVDHFLTFIWPNPNKNDIGC